MNTEKIKPNKANTTNQIVKTSKFLSLILRHQPEAIGLQLNNEGWADIAQLLALANQHGKKISHELLCEVVRTNEKQRFAISEDGQFIRANQGHSIEVDLQLQPSVPPTVLFHGTATRFLASIQQQGLLPGSRQHVHLSSNRETAHNVGARHGLPVILEIAALELHQQGQAFYLSQNGVWLSANIAVKFIQFPDQQS